MSDLHATLIPSDVCIVGFASMGEDCGGGIPPFEWARTFSDLGVATVLMRDQHKVWYQRGVDGLGDVDMVAQYVANLRYGYRRVITTGISMGGYAAILFGCLGNATEIVAMSPQTILQDDDRWDRHWEAHVHPIAKHRDLAPLCAAYKGRHRIFIGSKDAQRDMRHAARVSAESVTIFQNCDHSGVGPRMRDMGFFRELVR